jgi:small subunit ribosomal protein S16
MVKIRLTKLGKRNDHFYRIIAIDESKKNGGQALQVFGHWHPKTGDKKIDKAAIEAWVAKGAQVSPAVTKLFA